MLQLSLFPTAKDASDLSASKKRVLDLMRDNRWHTATEILEIAEGTEGLRRLRELRDYGYTIEKRRNSESRVFEYRLEQNRKPGGGE